MLAAFLCLGTVFARAEEIPEDLSTVAGLKEASYTRIMRLSANLRGFEEEAPEGENTVQKTGQDLAHALKRYRTLAAQELKLRIQELSALEDKVREANNACGSARYALKDLRGVQAERLQKYLSKTDDEVQQAKLRGRAEARLKTAYIDMCVTCEIAAAFTPSGDTTVRNYRPRIGERTVEWSTRRVGRLVMVLRELADRIVSLDVNNVIVPRDVDPSTARFLVKVERDVALEEYRRIAAQGYIIDPETNRPIKNKIRTEAAAYIERNLVEYLRYTSRPSEWDKIFSWMDWKDSRPGLADDLESSLNRQPEYRILGYLDSGIEPTPKEYFLAAALAINAEREALIADFNKDYLGDGFWNSDLGQLLRSNDAAGTGDAGYTAVKARLDMALDEMDALARVFNAAAKDPPERLIPKYHKLLKDFGYIVTYMDEEAGEEKDVYTIPGTTRALGGSVSVKKDAFALPGASALSVVSPKSVVIMIGGIVIPELAAGMLVQAAGGLLMAERSLLALRVLANMASDAAYNMAIDETEAFFDPEHRVNHERTILESTVLGLGTDLAGKLTQGALAGTLNRLAKSQRETQLYRVIEKAERANAKRAKELLDAVFLAADISTETAVTAAFQKYVEGEDVDITAIHSTLLNGALVRAIDRIKRRNEQDHRPALDDAALIEEGIRKYAPKFIRDALDGDARFKEEVKRNLARGLEETARVRKRFESDMREKMASGKDTADILFKLQISGDYTFSELKQIYADDPGTFEEVKKKLAEKRVEFFEHVLSLARKAATGEVNRHYSEQVEAAVREAGGRQQAKEVLEKLHAQWNKELDLINEEIKQRGSTDAFSDIDRSVLSPYLRRHLVRVYETQAQWFNDGKAPTSARAFDVNEYLNVFPFITENSRLVQKIREANPGHADILEAITISGAVQHDTPEQAEAYFNNLRERIRKKIDRGDAAKKDLEDLNGKIEFAKTLIGETKAELDKLRTEVAREDGTDTADKEVDRKARERLYDRRVREIHDLLWDLSKIEEAAGSRDTPEGLELRALIERKMCIAMRDGIETYSSFVGLDIIVNHVQSVRVPVLDKNGNQVTEGGVPQTRALTIAERIDDPNFTLKGDLRMYKPQDIDMMINDQVMFLMDHVNGFLNGGEHPYVAGRGLGKYLERVLLAMKVGGLDIQEVRKRPESDPTRKLLEIAQKLVEAKGSPKDLLKTLTDASRRQPAMPENGLLEIFYLMEQVIPGMKGMTGVVTSPMPAVRVLPPHRNPHFKKMVRTEEEKDLQFFKTIEEVSGNQEVVDHITAEIDRDQREIAELEIQLREMQEMARRYRLSDWDTIRRLHNQYANLHVFRASLPWHQSQTFRDLSQEMEGIRAQLDRLESGGLTGDVDAKLYNDPRSILYRRMKNRLQFLQERRRFLETHREKAEDKARREALFADLNLSGRWECGLRPAMPGKVDIVHEGDDVTMVLTWKDRNSPGPHVTFKARHKRGRLVGRWFDRTTQTVPTLSDQKVTPTTMTFEAWIKPEGDEFQLTYAPKHPRANIDWSGMIFRRFTSTEAIEEAAFVSVTQGPLPPDISISDEETRGLVSAVVRDPGGRVSHPGFQVIRGRRRVSGGWGQWITPGDYKIAVKVGGRTITEMITVASRMRTLVTLKPGGIQIKEMSAPGREVENETRVYSQEGEGSALVRIWAREGRPVFLAPGNYKLELGGQTGLPIWKENVGVRVGAITPLTVNWATLRASVEKGDTPPRIEAVREAPGEKAAGPWIGFAKERVRSTGGVVETDLPAGDFEVRFRVGEKTVVRHVSLSEGEEKEITLKQ
ncbi:MAG: hypothetical protein ABII06_10090 [Pseudomonadota bacterium]